ncbi:MAG: DUF4926 domain-containing protein [Limisphaerales bacterium]
MKINEHDCVALTADLPGERLRAGDVGTVVHIHKHGAPYEVEFVTPDGRTSTVATVESNKVRPISSHGLAGGGETASAGYHPQALMSKHHPKGLDGRERDQDGQIREKRGDTRVGTLRKEYGPDFAKGYRSDTKLETVREDTGKSLSELVKKT